MKAVKMMFAAAMLTVAAGAYAQSDEELFGSSDDDLFGSDSMFEVQESSSNDALAHGALFEDGSIKIGGAYDMNFSSYTTLYQEGDDRNFGERISGSGVSSNASATFSIDARPTQTLRMYTKFSISYATSASVDTSGLIAATPELAPLAPYLTMLVSSNAGFTPSIKEVFTDFSLFDRAYFRVGLHTVSWGTGFFFSPVSDMINTSSINPEDTSAFVNGCLNLRTQITFPGTQNCLWLYVIPDTNGQTVDGSASFENQLITSQFPVEGKRTGFAAKGEFVLGGWELGAGFLFKYQSAPKLMATASGSILNGKIAVFAEGVYSYGSASEWAADPSSWSDKSNIIQFTAGGFYNWKDPQITIAAQYYWDGNLDDHQYLSKGNNVAATVNFGKIAGTTDLTGTVLGLFYIGKDPVSSVAQVQQLTQNGLTPNPIAGIVSASLNYTPTSVLTLSAGPYITWTDFSQNPVVAFKLGAKIGGKF